MSEQIPEQFEFLTGITYCQEEYVGIIANHDNNITTFYDLAAISTPELRQEFLEYGEIWWWESNRMLPIDVFLHYEMQQFKHCMRTFATKDVDVLYGPVTSLQNLLKKRIKRKSIQLVRKTD